MSTIEPWLRRHIFMAMIILELVHTPLKNIYRNDPMIANDSSTSHFQVQVTLYDISTWADQICPGQNLVLDRQKKT